MMDSSDPAAPDATRPDPRATAARRPHLPDGSGSTSAAVAAQDGPARPAEQGNAPPATPSSAPSPASPFAATATAPQPPDLAARLAAVNQITDPDTRQATEANIRLRTQRQIMAFTDQQRTAKAEAKAIIDQGGDLSAIPAKLILGIDKQGRQALQDYARAHGNPRTDPVTYYGLKNQALDDPAGFQAVDLSNHMAQLATRDYGALAKLQNDLRSGQLPADFPLQQVYKAQTDRLLQQLGLPDEATGAMPDGDAAEKLQAAAKFRRDVDLHLAAHQAA
ncbi:MAG TPA: hypothetical protein VM659_02860, partial [Dongiaceae bacterium]|nr:hypothetical protein [Dongiaceae bacterium]